MTEQNNSFDIHITPSFKKFYSDSSSYGIYAVNVTKDSPNQDKIKEIDDWTREINIVGSMPELDFDKLYIAEVIIKIHPKYGSQYEVKTIYQKPFSTRQEQIMFIGSLLTSKQVETLIEAYPDDDLISLIKENRINLDLLKGIGEKTFQKIKEKIELNEKYQNAIIELTGKFQIPFNAVKRLSDRYGSPDLLLQKINENPYLLTEVDGFGFKKVDEIALSMGVEKNSSHRIKSCIIYLLDDHADKGHTWVNRFVLISDAIKLLNVRIKEVEEVIESAKGEESCVFSEVNEKIYLTNNYLYEVGILYHLSRVQESTADYKIEKIEEIIVDVEKKQGFPFTEEQLTAINYAIENNVVVVNGKAGTGKTSVIKGIVEVLKSVDGLGYATCALSGKASQRIQESTGLDAYTIHRVLAYNPTRGWGYNENMPMPYDIVILDEASMVNAQLFFFLLRAIKSGAKIIITGDTAQLEPIGVGNVLVDILASKSIPAVELTMVHRQAQKSGILSCANMVRDGISFMKDNDYSNQRLGELKDLYVYPYKDKEKVLNTVLDIAKKYNGDIMEFQILVPMKTRGELSTQNLNKELQRIFNRNPDDIDKRKKIERKNVTFLEDDKVIINGNNYDKEVFNGTMGIIEYIDSSTQNGEIVINFDGVGRISFTKEEMNKIDLGYAITIHKSQGSQWRYVVMALDYASYVLLNRQSVYTGMTRAKEALFMPVELKALQYAIRTDKSSKRNTFLEDLLRAK